MKKPTEVGFGCFGYKVSPTRGCGFLGRYCLCTTSEAETAAHRYFNSTRCRCFCIYGFCLDYVHRLSCCLVRYLTLSNLFHPHQKHTINYFYRRQGFRPPIIIHFWWRWRLVAGRVQHAFTSKGLQQFFSTY